jgi:hypothetical protein
MTGRQQTAPPQQRSSKDDTAHPHQPGARPEPPHPDPAHSLRHHPAKAEVKFPLQNRIEKVEYSSRSPDGWDQIPPWSGGGACTSHPGVLGSIPKREEAGKSGRHPCCVKVPGSLRVPPPPPKRTALSKVLQ